MATSRPVYIMWACCLLCVSASCAKAAPETIALWLFDEPQALYPSSVLDSSSQNDYPLVIGPGGQLISGKFGNALTPTDRPPIQYPPGPAAFGLQPPQSDSAAKTNRLTWANARFAALMTSGEKHLRDEVGFVNPTTTKLNLGAFDWTVEFWLQPNESTEPGIVFELGTDRQSANNKTTSLELAPSNKHFLLHNTPSNTTLKIPTSLINSRHWQHLVFVYSSSDGQLKHFVDGKLQQLPPKCFLKALNWSITAYFSLGRDGNWNQALAAAIDELRFSTGQVYLKPFQPPTSFATPHSSAALTSSPPLLFDSRNPTDNPISLANRKHLFIDDALIAELENATFVINPPTRAERVFDNLTGPFRKHLTVVEDNTGIIRIYNSVDDDFLAVRVSKDGINFKIPHIDLADKRNLTSKHPQNIVIPENVGGLGNPFIDPNGPDHQRWKYFSDYNRRGIYLYTSPDGYNWTRAKTATLPFRSGTQSCTFYDDQRQRYVSYHRSGIFHTPANDTQRSSVVIEHKNLRTPIEFTPLSQQDYLDLNTKLPLRSPLPWYLDNGPLTPGGFGMEFPHAFDPIPQDPPGTDIYITKAQKYPWAPDTYVAFPTVYFHYEPDGPNARNILATPQQGRGSGPVETQLSVSRNGLDWTRHPRPSYVGIGHHLGRDVVTAYLAHGMVRRGNEIWQYYFGETQYHSALKRNKAGQAVYRLIQRLDGFVSIDSPYGNEALLKTKPLTFTGKNLTLNIDTEATGYAQVGLLDEHGKPIEGYSLDDCIYINGDFIDTKIQWLGKGSDISKLAGQTIQLVVRMRGSKLYAMQFVD